ncbi:MAG: T9SS type A sorting domain-containing protein [Flavobacteriales bacterium]|nr:T9SS type A sorting domain-containing protein [Flavobacteriales bacterium]MCB9167389.1 T9SS type A sorting domain-containing protein [Flavobacteriales bacterium]
MMNKIYLSCCLLTIAGGLSAQRTGWAPHPRTFQKAVVQAVKEPAAQGTPKAGPGDVVFYEDFANGLAGNNGFDAWTVAGADGSVWAYDTDGPNGDFCTPSEHITSTTFSNGFMIFDSNLFNNGCTTCQVLDGYLVSPVLDLSATPDCYLAFEEDLVWCCSNDPGHFVDVSTDGGVTWPTRFTIATYAETNNSITVNESIGTHTRRFDLSDAIAVDPTNVRFRFSHEGNTSGNITHYFWQIDDVQIVESHPTDIRLVAADLDSWEDFGLTDNIEYNIYPYSQLRELNFRGRFENFGSMATDVQFNVNVANSGGTSIFDQTGTVTMPAHAVMDSVIIDGFVPPAMADDYDVTFTASSDSADGYPEDNMAAKSFSVDPFIYAMDNGKRDPNGRELNAYDNDGEAFMIGNIFWAEASATVYAIQVCVANGSGNTAVGATFDAQLLDQNLDFLESTNEFEVTSATQLTGANQSKWITLLLNNPVDLNAGEEYTAVLEHFGGTDNVAAAISGESVPGESLLYDTPTDTWFYVTSTPMVRLVFDPSIGIAEVDRRNGVGLGQCFPNPARGTTMIPYDLDLAASVTFAVHDLSGKVVMTLDEGRQSAGSHSIQVNTDQLTEGVYFYTLSANGAQLTKRMSVVR